MALTLFESDIFRLMILPFILIFTLVFAVLEKSKLLGDEKRQIDAIVAAIVAAILIGFSKQVEWIRQFAVFFGVALFIYFIFMLLWGFSFGVKDGDVFKESKAMKYILGAIAFVAIVVAVLLITDTWNKVYDFFSSEGTGTNLLFIIVIAAAIAAVVFTGGKKGGSSGG